MANNQNTSSGNNSRNTTLETMLKYGALGVVGGILAFKIGGGIENEDGVVRRGLGIGTKDIYIVNGSDSVAYEAIKQHGPNAATINIYDGNGALQQSAPQQDAAPQNANESIGWFQAIRNYTDRRSEERAAKQNESVASYQGVMNQK
jgi:hypothetical protein